ncbi:MAG: two-component system, OmpR family, phosphate regulon sensor histidine kinase PhoR [Thermoplasmata archaeon]|nr:two-component system, OmpR family, phosphate regulon sensor histidine kinase PhoR [Thermoplasmata archaeon]
MGPAPSSRWAPDPVLRAALDVVPSAIAVIDSVGTLLHCNTAWRALAGRTAPFGELGSLVTPADHEGSPYLRRLAALEGPLSMPARRLAHAIQDTLNGRSVEARVAYRMRRPDGETPFEALVSLIPDAKVAIVQHMDCSEPERAADAEAAALRLGLQAEALRSRARRLERRIASVGQDLHTPLTPVRLELHLLQSGALGPLNPAQAKAMALAARNVQRMAEGEEAFLRVPGEIAPPKVTFDLAELARDAVDARQTEALQQGVQLALHVHKALPVSGQADSIRDVLDRFLDLALAASPAGSAVAVEASLHGADAVVTVRDSGPGLTARDVKGAFEPWSGKGLHDASGDLSLHHSRSLVEADGGRAWAESDGPGQGLLLAFALPVLKDGGFAR